MEGARASMLSPAAELAAWGMYSAEEETEFPRLGQWKETESPSDVEDLIRRLGEKNWSYWSTRDSTHSYVAQYPTLSHPELEDFKQYCIVGQPEVKDFFRADATLSTNIEWRCQVRLRVLEAIGSYISSFDELDPKRISGHNISTLTASEWEVVLRGFRSSSVLRWMIIDELDWRSEADLESLGLQLGIILNTSSVTDLRIVDLSRLTARFFLNLASGLRENSHSKLKSIQLGRDWGNANAVRFFVEVLNGQHQLETLSLGSKWDCYREDYVDEAAIRLVSQALKQNSCLKELVLQGLEGGCAALLLNALAGDDGNRSIEQLKLKRMSGIGKCLAEVFISNRSLRVVTLRRIDMHVEEWRLLGQAIRDNATATTVDVGDYGFGISRLKELEEFSRAASSEGKEPSLHLETC